MLLLVPLLLCLVVSESYEETDCRPEEVLTKKECTRIVGTVTYTDTISTVFKRTPPVKIHGRLIFEDQSAEDLSAIANLTVIGNGTPAVVIRNNKKLVDMSGLLTMTISGKEPVVEISDNDKICAPIEIRRKIRELARADVEFDSSCLPSCEGGEIDRRYLEKLDEIGECRVIKGDLIIKGFTDNTSALGALNRIEKIENGALIIQHNAGFGNIWFLENLEEISHPESKEPALQIANNFDLESVGLNSLRRVRTADPDKAIEIYTFDDVPDSDKKRFESVALRREVFNIGMKDIKETRRVMEPYQYNAAWGIATVIGLVLLMAIAPGLILLALCRRANREENEEASLL